VKRALILAGGGVAGIAWELGVLRGLRDADRRAALIADSADILRNVMLALCGGAREGLAGQPQDQGTTISVGGTNEHVPANLMLKVSNLAMKLR